MGPRLCEEQPLILLGAPGRKRESQVSLEGFRQEAGASVFPGSSHDTWDLPSAMLPLAQPPFPDLLLCLLIGVSVLMPLLLRSLLCFPPGVCLFILYSSALASEVFNKYLASWKRHC